MGDSCMMITGLFEEEPKTYNREKDEIYKLYKGMTPSMQRAVKNVMRVGNGLAPEWEDEKVV